MEVQNRVPKLRFRCRVELTGYNDICKDPGSFWNYQHVGKGTPGSLDIGNCMGHLCAPY